MMYSNIFIKEIQNRRLKNLHFKEISKHSTRSIGKRHSIRYILKTNELNQFDYKSNIERYINAVFKKMEHFIFKYYNFMSP